MLFRCFVAVLSDVAVAAVSRDDATEWVQQHALEVVIDALDGTNGFVATPVVQAAALTAATLPACWTETVPYCTDEANDLVDHDGLTCTAWLPDETKPETNTQQTSFWPEERTPTCRT